MPVCPYLLLAGGHACFLGHVVLEFVTIYASGFFAVGEYLLNDKDANGIRFCLKFCKNHLFKECKGVHMKTVFLLIFLAVGAVASTMLLEYSTLGLFPVFIWSIPFCISAVLAFISNIVIKKHKAKIMVFIIFIFAGIFCLIVYHAIGAKVDKNGTLREVFGLSVIGEHLMLAGVMMVGNILKRQRIPLLFGVLGLAIILLLILVENILTVSEFIGFGSILLGISLIYISLYWSIICIYNNRNSVHKKIDSFLKKK